jgi:hypothetical protein
VSSVFVIRQTGTGALRLRTEDAAPIEFYTSNTSRVTIDQNGLTTFNKNVTINGDVNANNTIYANNYVWLQDDPVNARHATTKQYVDSRIPNYSFSYGVGEVYQSQNVVGKWYEDRNYFDVFPPAGKTMSDFVAFIPSIHYIAYAGQVDGNDTTNCYWRRVNSSGVSTGGSATWDRIRVWIGNTEMRAKQKANWLAVWN